MINPDARIGLIGLGNAGQAMLTALAREFPLIAYDRDETRRNEAGRTGGGRVTIAPNAMQVATDCKTIILALPSPEASRMVCEEIASAIVPGTLVIETGTVGCGDVDLIHDLLEPSGARVIDAAIVGGIARLRDGDATLLVGSTREDIASHRAVFGAMADDVQYLGKRGAGMRMKLVVNAVAHATYVVLCEAGAIAAAQGLPLKTLRDLLVRETGLMRPLTHRFNERLVARDFDGGMSTANARKDSQLALDLAETLDVPLFAIRAAHEVYQQACDEGFADADYSAVASLWEGWLDIDLSDRNRSAD